MNTLDDIKEKANCVCFLCSEYVMNERFEVLVDDRKIHVRCYLAHFKHLKELKLLKGFDDG